MTHDPVPTNNRPFYGSLEELAPPHLYQDPSTAAIVDQRDRLGRNIATALMADEALAAGDGITWIDDTYALASHGSKRLLLAGSRNRASRAAASLVTDKWLTKELLLKGGVATAQGRLIKSAEEAIEFQQLLGRPIVVKPRFGYGGKAVAVNLVSPADISHAYQEAARHGDVVAEEYIENVVEFRCMASKSECVSVVGRILPWVSGDGQSSIGELIASKNQFRNTIPSTRDRLIPTDQETLACLAMNSRDLATVPSAGENVVVRKVGGLTSGGEPFECSNLVDAQVKDLAISAVRSIPGLNWAGVDVIVTATDDAYVVEINTSADTLGSRFPWYGTPVALQAHMYADRVQAAPDAGGGTPRFPAIRPHPRALTDLSIAASKREQPLAALLRRRIRAMGWRLERKSAYLELVTQPDQSSKWMQGTATTADLNIARRAAQRHQIVRGLLAVSSIPRPISTDATTLADVDSFRAAIDADIALVPHNKDWGSRAAVTVRRDEALPDLGKATAWTVQKRHEGQRVRVIATPNEVLAVFGEQQISYPQLALLASLAVRSVRAVPELRWAAVDIVILEKPARFSQLVEGISTNPLMPPHLRLLAGSLDDLVRYMFS